MTTTNTANAALVLDTADMDAPAVYVANLAAYNAGSLRGAWINPSSDVDDLHEQILAAIGGNADNEWAIHDYNMFPNLGEHASVKDIAKVAGLFEEHDHDAVNAAIDEAGVRYLDQAESMLENGFREFDKREDEAMEEYAQELADDGVLDAKFLLQYVDWSRVARDVRMDVHVVEKNGKTFIFND
jgi:antirestriction protein